MATLELTIASDYVSWGVWESLRELLQNWKDAEDLGHESKLWAGKAGNGDGSLAIKMMNDGVTLDREKLILGASSKRGDPRQRGQFGEGMKLAWASLLRHGLTIRIKSGTEAWTPEIGWSETFGCELLKVKTAKCKHYDGILIEVRGVHEDDWKTVKSRLLWETPPKQEEVIEVTSGRILTGDKHSGLLFSKGIYVSKLPDDYVFGYDIPVELDRDRKMADPWSLKWNIAEAIRSAVSLDLLEAKVILDLLERNPNSGEALIFNSENAAYHRGSFHEKVAAEFASEHGDNAVPVASMGDAMEAEHHGMKGVVVSGAVKAIIEVEHGTFESRKVDRATDVTARHGFLDLTDEQSANLTRAIDCIDGIEGIPDEPMKSITIVDFVGRSILGTFCEGKVQISLVAVESPSKLMTVLVHEFAHQFGADGTVAHRDAMDSIFSDIITREWK